MNLREGMQELTVFIGDAVIPRKYRRSISRYVEVAGITWSAYKVFGVLVYIIAFLSVMSTLVLVQSGSFVSAPIFVKFVWFAIFCPAFFFLYLAIGRIAVKYIIDVRVYRKVQLMEEVFPEFLTELSLNLKSGQSLEQSLLLAAKEDYGPLSDEMLRVFARSDLGFSTRDSLESFTENYPSDMMRETFDLISISLRRGGQTPRLIDRLVANMKIRRNLRDKIVASVANYRIFLATVTVLIAPAMMALSFHVISLIRTITTDVMQVTGQSAIPITINAVRFNELDFVIFSALTLVIISTFSSLIVTYIKSGTARGGTRQLFFYVISSLGSYFVFMLVFASFFGLFQTA